MCPSTKFLPANSISCLGGAMCPGRWRRKEWDTPGRRLADSHSNIRGTCARIKGQPAKDAVSLFSQPLGSLCTSVPQYAQEGLPCCAIQPCGEKDGTSTSQPLSCFLCSFLVYCSPELVVSALFVSFLFWNGTCGRPAQRGATSDPRGKPEKLPGMGLLGLSRHSTSETAEYPSVSLRPEPTARLPIANFSRLSCCCGPGYVTMYVHGGPVPKTLNWVQTGSFPTLLHC